ncbi:hypothetical protein ACGIF2_08695 [Cellulomonas sp. P22]|uniref:hypothetical protein n=1 Tax=Cellulomonas sp. P22 TaxID=3373189 RepID=UPI0037B3F3C7
MSTVPGKGSWHDAGLTEPSLSDAVEVEPPPFDPDAEETDPDELGPDAEDEAGVDVAVVDTGHGVVEEYRPADPRPDLRGEADEGDVTEQTRVVPVDDRDDYP